ncbi:MAG: ribulose-phosphate 3-epimerase [Desulfosudaceae bacterium]
MKKIAPSILSADFTRLGEEVRAVDQAGADWIHVDVMDGCFVPNLTIGPMVAKAVRTVTELPLDVHLMINDPDRYLDEFVSAGADYLAVHAEACPHLHRTVQYIRKAGVKAGVALNPGTSPEAVRWVLADLELVVVMSVNPGFGGQGFIPNSLDKIRALKTMIREQGLSTLIQVDGGVNSETVADIAAAGADVLVAGSAVFKSADYGRTITTLRQLAG